MSELHKMRMLLCPSCGKKIDLAQLRDEFCPFCLNSISDGRPRPDTLQRAGRNIKPEKLPNPFAELLNAAIGYGSLDSSGVGALAILVMIALPILGIVGVILVTIEVVRSLF
jgi:hypothetical protein